MMRAIVSVGPPAEYGTTMEIGRDGYVCASARAAPTKAAITRTGQRSLIMKTSLVNLSQRGEVDRPRAVERALARRQRVFEAGGAIEQHDARVAVDPPVGETLLERGVGRGALRTQQEPFRARYLAHRRGDRLVIDRDREAAALAHGAQDEKIADRLRHTNARRDGVRIFPARRVLLARLVGAHDGRAARRLHCHHARALGPDEADRLELGECLPHADEPGSAAGGIEDHVRQLPAELLGKLEAHRLLALDPIRLLPTLAVATT